MPSSNMRADVDKALRRAKRAEKVEVSIEQLASSARRLQSSTEIIVQAVADLAKEIVRVKPPEVNVDPEEIGNAVAKELRKMIESMPKPEPPPKPETPHVTIEDKRTPPKPSSFEATVTSRDSRGDMKTVRIDPVK